MMTRVLADDARDAADRTTALLPSSPDDSGGNRAERRSRSCSSS